MNVHHYLCVFWTLLVTPIKVAEGRPRKVLGASLFPQAESPYSGDAPIPIFGQECGEVSVFRNTQLSEYGQIATALYTPPQRSDWSQAILNISGAVRGVQFDRFGAVWLSGVEILRLTTPEPTTEGIAWQVSRDITSLLPILRTPGNMTLQIPNVVDATYTGVLHISINIKFYCSPPKTGASPTVHKYIRSLQTWANPNIFNISLSGNQTQVHLVSNLPRNMRRATLEVFASGHGCEEFWYTNLPDADTPSGGCGGGAYREIEVFIDGLVAGAAYPFPVIYTGGVNPLLWRPLTGIASFNIPPYVFDLSPFLGVLNDGGIHNISLAVRHNNKAGVWYVDPVLHADLDASSKMLSGRLIYHSDVKPPVKVEKTSKGNATIFITQSLREIKVVGSLAGMSDDGVVVATTHKLKAFNNNTLVGADLQISGGWMAYDTETSISDDHDDKQPAFVQRKTWYPYYVLDNSSQDRSTMQIGPTVVNYSRFVRLNLREKHTPEYSILISSDINATALYNRSLTNHSLVYKQQGTSEENNALQVSNLRAPCYTRRLVAADGYTIQKENGTEACSWKNALNGVYACGLSFCEQIDGIGRDALSFVPSNAWLLLPQTNGSQSVSNVWV